MGRTRRDHDGHQIARLLVAGGRAITYCQTQRRFNPKHTIPLPSISSSALINLSVSDTARLDEFFDYTAFLLKRFRVEGPRYRDNISLPGREISPNEFSVAIFLL